MTVDTLTAELSFFELIGSDNLPLLNIVEREAFLKSLRDETQNNTATILENNDTFFALVVKIEGKNNIGINTYIHFKETFTRDVLSAFIKKYLEINLQIKNSIVFKPIKNYIILIGEGQVTPKNALELTFDAVVKGTDLRAFGAYLRKVQVYCIALPIVDMVRKVANLMSIGKNVKIVDNLNEAKRLVELDLNSTSEDK